MTEEIQEKTRYNTNEAAEYLNLSAAYLNTLRSQKKGPSFYKKGRLIYYTKDDLEKFSPSRKEEQRIECET